VAYLIMPVFALANAGITFTPELMSSLFHPVAIGVFLGLLAGKPIGIMLMAWITVRLKLSVLPDGVSWKQLLGLGFLAGIGFTMSIFINTLAFGGTELEHPAKAGIIAASLVAAITGVMLLMTGKGEKTA
jgi:NhaA family Na+:H+ antiporter